jgi:hypothetical protein
VTPNGGGCAGKAAQKPPVSELESPKLNTARNLHRPSPAAVLRYQQHRAAGRSSCHADEILIAVKKPLAI